MAFQDQLKKLLFDRGMKAVDLARATGLSEAAISDYLKGKKEPRGKQSIAIAKALNVSLDTLWETDYQSKGIELSPLQRKVIADIELMGIPELAAVKAFIDSLDEYKKNLGMDGNKPEE